MCVKYRKFQRKTISTNMQRLGKEKVKFKEKKCLNESPKMYCGPLTCDKTYLNVTRKLKRKWN
jgi:hypothetical protein